MFGVAKICSLAPGSNSCCEKYICRLSFVLKLTTPDQTYYKHQCGQGSLREYVDSESIPVHCTCIQAALAAGGVADQPQAIRVLKSPATSAHGRPQSRKSKKPSCWEQGSLKAGHPASGLLTLAKAARNSSTARRRMAPQPCRWALGLVSLNLVWLARIPIDVRICI